MEDAFHQKIYFQYTFSTYPTLSYNQIVLNLVEKYNVKKIHYNLNSFNVFKTNFNKKKFVNKSVEEKLRDIKLYGKNLCVCKFEYLDVKHKDTNKIFYVFATQYSLSLLNSPDINQYFTDCTYKCVPNDLKGKYSLLVLMGYNFKSDKFQLILIALLSNEDTDIYVNLYNFLYNTYNFEPKRITFDFALGNLNAIKKVYGSVENITIVPCFFHLTQAWWKNANKCGLRKSSFINDAKCMIFNLQMIAFMDYKSAREYYNLIKEEYPDTTEEYMNFYHYFEKNWLSLENPLESKYEFNLWSYYEKFNFKGNKKKLISEGNLQEYVNFTNNGVESFNHLLNGIINHNNKVSFAKFEELIKYVFIRMEGSKDINNINGYEEKTLISDILKELIDIGYGKNNKLIKRGDLKKLKSIHKLDDIYKLTFENLENDIVDNN